MRVFHVIAVERIFYGIKAKRKFRVIRMVKVFCRIQVTVECGIPVVDGYGIGEAFLKVV